MANTFTKDAATGREIVIKSLFVYRQTSNISSTLVSNNIVDHSDVVGASTVGCFDYIFIFDLTPDFSVFGWRLPQDEMRII